MTKQRLENIENHVIQILNEDNNTRSNDNLLYLELLSRLGFDTDIKLSDYLVDSSYPNYNSVSRARRKAQEKFPELKPSKLMCSIIEMEQQEYIAYAIGGKQNGRV